MLRLALPFRHQDYSDAALNASIQAILEGTALLAMATINVDGTAHINSAYFSFDDSLRLFFVTDPATTHAQNLLHNQSVAITVADTHQQFWTPLRGLQIFGTCSKTSIVQLPHALASFLRRFPAFREAAQHPADFAKKTLKARLFTVDVTRVKLFDEPTFGEELFIDLSVALSKDKHT